MAAFNKDKIFGLVLLSNVHSGQSLIGTNACQRASGGHLCKHDTVHPGNGRRRSILSSFQT